MASGKNKVMFGVPSFISSQSQQLGQNLNLGQEYTPETAAKMQALERRQQLANILLQQGMQPKEARQAGRFVVAPSMWEQASGPLTTAMGALSSLYLDDQRSAIASDEAKRVAAAYQAYNEGTSEVPGYVGRRVAGTGVQGAEAQPAMEEPSNLELIIAANQVPTRPDVMRKSVADVTNAMAQRQMPPMLQSDPQWDGPAAIPTPYRPAVETKAAVPGVVGKPDRRESPYEALEREFGAQAAQDFVNNGFAPGTTPETAARMERVVKDAERPDAPGRPRTPGELMAADTALLASGAPGAWPLIQLTKQQREMDLARKENLEERRFEAEGRIQTARAEIERKRQSDSDKQDDRDRHFEYLKAHGATEEELKRESIAIRRASELSTERYQRDMTELKRQDLQDKAASREEKAKIAKQFESKAAAFASRMEQAEIEAEASEADVNVDALGFQGGLEKIPVVGGLGSTVMQYNLSPKTKQYQEARRFFINAVLRSESGATVTQSEFENAAVTYFAQPGDKQSDLQRKKEFRKEAIRGMVQEAGPAWHKPQPSPPKDQELEDIKNIYKRKP